MEQLDQTFLIFEYYKLTNFLHLRHGSGLEINDDELYISKLNCLNI